MWSPIICSITDSCSNCLDRLNCQKRKEFHNGYDPYSDPSLGYGVAFGSEQMSEKMQEELSLYPVFYDY